jgi:peptide/nickel transport system permease protein
MDSSIHASGSAPGPVADPGGQHEFARPSGLYRLTAGRLFRHPQIRIGLVLTGLVCVMALLGPVLPIANPLVMFDRQELKAPSLSFWFGTDLHGRDLFSRVVWGGRVALGVGIFAVGLGLSVGVTSGLMVSYSGGLLDSVVSRLFDTLLAFPSILIGIAVATALGPGLMNAAVAAGVVSIPVFSRLARVSVLTEREKEYVMAGGALGASDFRLMFRHILPNMAAPITIQVTVTMAYAAILEASLSFLGLGTQPPDPSWGTMLNEARPYLERAPWYALFPGMALSTLLVGLNLLADGVRDVLDPTQSRSR